MPPGADRARTTMLSGRPQAAAASERDVQRPRALISVTTRRASSTSPAGSPRLGVELFSTGGTARLLREPGVPVRDVADVTGFPEMMDGRVKTLHPKIHGGILARRDCPSTWPRCEHGIVPFDLVVVNLYPFEATIARPGVTLDEAIEQIDIGGPTMIRAAAKNHAFVARRDRSGQYAAVLDELRARATRWRRRARVAGEAFRRTAEYDAAIAEYLRAGAARRASGGRRASGAARVSRPSARDAALRREPAPGGGALPRRRRRRRSARRGLTQLHGKELCYNNLLDSRAALALLLEFGAGRAVVIKHNNPCGVAGAPTLGEAMRQGARPRDPVSIYGGIVGQPRRSTWRRRRSWPADLCRDPRSRRPSTTDALEELRRDEEEVPRAAKCRCDRALRRGCVEFRSVPEGCSSSRADLADLERRRWQVVTQREPTEAELAALRFAWRVAKHVKSNAIVLATRGPGGRRRRRPDEPARLRAHCRSGRARSGSPTRGTVCASDAFFPFRDGLEAVAQAGATAVHPAGRLAARRGGDRRRRRARHGDGVHGIRHFRH